MMTRDEKTFRVPLVDGVITNVRIEVKAASDTGGIFADESLQYRRVVTCPIVI